MPKGKKTHAEKDAIKENPESTKHEKTRCWLNPKLRQSELGNSSQLIPRNLMSVLVQQPHLLP